MLQLSPAGARCLRTELRGALCRGTHALINRFATVEAVDEAFAELRRMWDGLLDKYTIPPHRRSPPLLEGTGEAVISFTVDVTNQSDRSVKEPVLLFISDLVATLTPDVKRLRAFTKVELAPGETKTVTLTVRTSDLAFVNEDLQWVLEPGQFRATVGNQQVEFGL